MSLSEKIKSQITLSKFIEEKTGVKFTQKGKNLWCRCPLHGEKTGSFVVYDYKQFFYCFGCHAHGDVFGFLMAYENKSFTQVLQDLCENLGLRYSSSEHRIEENALQIILQQAYEHYKSNLYKFEFALKYAKERHIDKYEGIGYANENDVIDHLLQKGHRMASILKSGIITTSNTDRLRNRIIFPIFNNNKVVAFAGRTMNEEIKPKYINYSETDLFQKQLCLFNDNFSRKSAPVVITEGYIDAIAIHLNTKYNGVCIMGTSLSSEQLFKALKINKMVYLMFDNDLAGQQAIERNLDNILAIIQPGDHVYICTPIQCKDADELLNNMSEEHFERTISESLRLSEWIKANIHKNDDESIESKSIIFEKVQQITSKITNKSIQIAYEKYLTKPNYIRKKQEKYSSVIECENIIMNILTKYPTLWIYFFDTLSVYSFSNKTYREINDFLCSYLIRKNFNKEMFLKAFEEKKYLLVKNKQIVNNFPHIIFSEEFSKSYVGDLLNFLQRQDN
jgi:DNA primase